MLNKSIVLDDNFVDSRLKLAFSYFSMNNSAKAKKIYESALIKSEEIKDKRGIASSLRGLGMISASQQDFEKHLDYINRAKHIYEEIGDERGIFLILHDIGNYYRAKGNYNQALDYYKRSISLSEKFGNQALSLFTTGRIYEKMGELDLSLDYYFRSQKLFKEQEDYFRLQAVTACIGIIYLYKNNINNAIIHLQKSHEIQIELGINAQDRLATTTYLNLSYKKIGDKIDIKEIHKLIKETENSGLKLIRLFEDEAISFSLYELLEDTFYLKTAYNQVQEKVDGMEEELAAKFLSYPIPKAIVEEWEKVTTDKN